MDYIQFSLQVFTQVSVKDDHNILIDRENYINNLALYFEELALKQYRPRQHNPCGRADTYYRNYEPHSQPDSQPLLFIFCSTPLFKFEEQVGIYLMILGCEQKYRKVCAVTYIKFLGATFAWFAYSP